MRSPIAISSGHGRIVRGAHGYIDEVSEARRVAERVAEELRGRGVTVHGPFHDDTSETQDENLETIVAWHNSRTRALDVSVHFNAYEPTDQPMGTECCYLTQETLADEVAEAISFAGHLENRGAKYRDDLYWLNNTHKPGVLIEVCFVDSSADVKLYQQHFGIICSEIAEALSGEAATKPEPERPPATGSGERPVAGERQTMVARGKVSWFGGPDDGGVAPDESLAFIYDVETKPELFLDEQPEDTTGLARRLNPDQHYIAMRWDYAVYPKEMLAGYDVALVRAPKTGKQFIAHPADWGPHEDTGRVADISPGLMQALGITTDDEVEVLYPYSEA
jgi:hypothetical protein